MKAFVLFLLLASGLGAQIRKVTLPQPPVEKNVVKLQNVHLPNWNGVTPMWTPKPSIVFMDIPIERIARERAHRIGYEHIGYKLYRRIEKKEAH
jgi:hypothetical protein